MRYTKEFKKYWATTNKYRYCSNIAWIEEELKRIAFRAWKAGIEKTKKDYCLIRPKDDSIILSTNKYPEEE